MRTLFKAVLLVISRITQNAKGIRNVTKQKIVFTNTCIKIIISRQKEWLNKVLIELKAIVEEYENDISLRHIGFPEDWYEQLEK